jgi:LmbE family N-acetylglucosaminyl deacetylase
MNPLDKADSGSLKAGSSETEIPTSLSPGLEEGDLIPYMTSPPSGEKIIVISPHPDDETLGMGGTISLLMEAQKKLKALFLTSGERADPSSGHKQKEYALMRENEAAKAMKVLGVADFEFLRFPDRGLFENLKTLKDALSKAIDDYSPDTIYCTSPVEPHPDHRAAAMASLSLQESNGYGIMFYECVAPLRPNRFVDISGVFPKKLKAMKAYKSQLKLNKYEGLIKSLNIYRTFTLGADIRYAESFMALDRPIGHDKLNRWLSYQSGLSDV